MPFSRRLSTTEQLRRLQSVTDAALGHLSFDSLAEEILVRIRDALEADTCAILLLDEERNELVARAAKGIEEEVEQGVRIPLGRGFAGRVAVAKFVDVRAGRERLAGTREDSAAAPADLLRAQGSEQLALELARERVQLLLALER